MGMPHGQPMRAELHQCVEELHAELEAAKARREEEGDATSETLRAELREATRTMTRPRWKPTNCNLTPRDYGSKPCVSRSS